MNQIKELVELLNKHRQDYYNGKPTVSDNEYDILEDKLRLLDPNNEFFKTVGSKESLGDDYIHEIPMLSAGKIQGDNKDEIDKWTETVSKYLGGISPENIKIIVEPKIDGVSIEVTYINGKLAYAATRGNGSIGKLIDPKRLNVPKKLKKKENLKIRGEAVIFKKYKSKLPEDTPLRNYCAGLIHKKELSQLEETLISFIPYQIVPIGNFDNELEMLHKIESLGFDIHIEYEERYLNNISAAYDAYITKWRDDFPYETDGLMIIIDDNELKKVLNESRVVSHHNHYNVAVKPTGVSGWTEITGIEWQVGRTGKITPVGILKPIQISDVVYTRVTLNNASFIYDNKINNGSKVLIVRSNDVIPKVIEVVNKKGIEPLIPTKCPVCNSKLKFNPKEDKELYCENNSCNGKLLGQFLHWFKNNDIINISEASLSKFLSDSKFTAIWQLYKASEADLKKMFENILGVSMDTPSMQDFLKSFNESRKITEKEALGYYGIPKIGLKTLEAYNINTFDELLKYKDLNYFDSSKLTLLSLHQWLNDEQNLNDLRYLIMTLRPTMNKPKLKVETFKYCITGEFEENRKEIIKKISVIKPSWEFVNTVNTSCNLLIVSKDKTSIKYQTAVKYNIPIIYFDNGIDWEYLAKA